MSVSVRSFDPSGFARTADTHTFREPTAFSVELEDTEHFGKHVRFLCDGQSVSAFPWHDHADADLRSLSERVLAGTLSEPFHDLDQSWELMIWRDRGWFYVLLGRGEPHGEFAFRVRIAVDRFVAAWRTLLAATRQESFRSLPEALSVPDRVRALLLGQQELTALSPEIARLRNLEHLELYLNQLETLPREIAELTSLRSIDLRHNRISHLPPEMESLRKLEEVNLAENHLREIPDWVLRLPTLKVFFVPENPISPDSLAHASQMRPDVEFTQEHRRGS